MSGRYRRKFDKLRIAEMFQVEIGLPKRTAGLLMYRSNDGDVGQATMEANRTSLSSEPRERRQAYHTSGKADGLRMFGFQPLKTSVGCCARLMYVKPAPNIGDRILIKRFVERLCHIANMRCCQYVV